MNKKNVWFLVSAILSTISSCLYGIFVIASIFSLINAESMAVDAPIENINAFKMQITVLLIFSLIAIGLSIFCSVVYFKYYQIPYQEMKSKMALPIIVTVFSFLSGNLLSGIFGVVGLCVNPEQDNETNSLNNLSNQSNIINENKDLDNLDIELNKLNSLKDKGLITEEQFNELKTNVINKYLQK